VLMPVNLRPPEWKTEVVTNFVSETRVSTTPANRRTPQALLRAIAARTTRIKEGESAALMELLSKTSRLPLWMKQPLSPFLWITGNRLVDTAVLSNLGALDDGELPDFGPDAGDVVGVWFSAPARMPCGLSLGAARPGSPRAVAGTRARPSGRLSLQHSQLDHEAVGVWFSAPARMPCGLSLGAVSAAGALHLAFRYRYPLWGPAAAAAFADRFVIELGVLEREAS